VIYITLKRLSIYCFVLPLLCNTLACSGAVNPSVDTSSDAVTAGGSADSADLPSHVSMRTKTESFNKNYWVAVRNGDIWVKPNPDLSFVNGQWQKLKLPKYLNGKATEISLDDKHMIALDGDNRVYEMTGALGDVSKFKWKTTWGAPLGKGEGINIPNDALAWSLSYASPSEDIYYTDAAGRKQIVGGAGCTSVFVLDADQQHIPVLDPWLPADFSFQLPGPKRGRFKSVYMSASGSTIFVINRYGDMFTRLFDFDMSGGDVIFFRYSYEDQRSKPTPDKLPIDPRLSTYPPIQLPMVSWKMQPKIHGQITGMITIIKRGEGLDHQILRVEGIDDAGNTGFYQKDISIDGSDAWQFIETGDPLRGQLLENDPKDRSDDDLGPSDDHEYAYASDEGWVADLLDFNVYASPATLRVQPKGGGAPFDLKLHTVDGLRQKKRAAGLDDDPRRMSGTIEAPQEWLGPEGPPANALAFFNSKLGGKQFMNVTVDVTRSTLQFSGIQVGLSPWRFNHISTLGDLGSEL